jgi:hypothetical protein
LDAGKDCPIDPSVVYLTARGEEKGEDEEVQMRK